MMRLLTWFILTFFSLLAIAKPFNHVIVFGDSLSDNGNLYQYMNKKLPKSPPYHQGRFSNGPVWVERLTESYFPKSAKDHLLDYAFGGAGIAENPEDDELLFTLKREMDTYFLAHDDKADPNSLFIIWIGANNYLGAPDDPEKAINNVNEGITQGLKRLAKAGAKHILVINLPNLGETPMAREFGIENQLSNLVNLHNERLAASTQALKESYPEIDWFYFDIKSVWSDLIQFPKKYGFNNITGTCYESRLKELSSKAMLRVATTIQAKDHMGCDGFLFFDPVHPTAQAHQLMAQRVKVFLDSLN